MYKGMANSIFYTKSYSVRVDGISVVKEVDIELFENELSLLVGPNGSGKSSLLKSIMYDDYDTKGDVFYQNKSIKTTPTAQRAKMWIFMIHQEPVEIPGVQILDLMRYSYNIVNPDAPLDPWSFKELFDVYADILEFSEDIAYRSINHGFSGGEKKRLELLQMLILRPKLVLIDEIDSGLDLEYTLKIFKIINEYVKEEGATVLMVSHNMNILEYVNPAKVYKMKEGKVVNSGNELLLTNNSTTKG